MTYPIIGMSPGNSYFKDAETRFLLEETVKRYGHTAILIADVPAISTYVAYGYPENRAKNKAIPKGNNLKNRSQRIAEELAISDKVLIIDWAGDIEGNEEYYSYYKSISGLYQTNNVFAEAVDRTTEEVLLASKRDITDIAVATKTAAHYLLSELAFLEYAPIFLKADEIVYVYYKNWPVYEKYIAGIFDGKVRNHLKFLVLTNANKEVEAEGGEPVEPKE